MLSYEKILSIAGSDSGGGAGIQADIKTISALGGYAMTVITAITAQNTGGVDAVYAVPADIIKQQCHSIYADMGADAVKIGMLLSADIVDVVLECVHRYPMKNIVLDPVMVAKDGSKLLSDDAIIALQDLLPHVDLITPNIPEAACLLNTKIESVLQMQEGAAVLAKKYRVNVLLKGGHLSGDTCVDIICLKEDFQISCIINKRIDTPNTHGTGCTFSAAIATYLAKECTLLNAIKMAQRYLYDAMLSGAAYTLGGGCGPVDHFYGVKCDA